ncbi:MAG: MFS transporter [Verrucomicrobia bacterium]|nr:MFS transporter [Verrucomicrobiota bacterium]
MKKETSLIFSVIVASFSGFQFGYNTAIISGALIYVAYDFPMSLKEQGWFVSIILLGALLGAMLASQTATRLGRKNSMMLAAVLFIVSGIMTGLGQELNIVTLGRFLQGAAIGLVSVVSPMYLAEISPSEKRGFYVSCNQFAITIGIVFAYGIAFLFAGNWHVMFGFGVVPALIQVLGLLFVIDSPAKDTEKGSWKTLFSPQLAWPLMIGLFVSIFQQITGINAVIYFAPTIFKEAGFGSSSGALLASFGIGIINVIATAVSLVLLDKWGRRPLLLGSLVGMAIALIVMSSALMTQSLFVGHISVICLMLYVAAFAMGTGPVPWLILSEIYIPSVRGLAMSLAIFVNWLSNFFVAFTFLDFAAGLTVAGTFFVYAALCVIGFFVAWKIVPETKGRSLNEIEKSLR